MATVTAFLGLGSNLGLRERHLQNGIRLLARSLEVTGVSSVYESEPLGYTDQPSFLNLVCLVQAGVAPNELLRVCKEIERTVGRKPTFRYGPRVLDIDILDYGGQVIATPDLEVPHPRLSERAFVLVPLAQLAPEWVHPVLGRSAAVLLGEIHEHQDVRLWGDPPVVPSVKPAF